MQNAWQQRLSQIQAQQRRIFRPPNARSCSNSSLISTSHRIMQQRAKESGFRVSDAGLLAWQLKRNLPSRSMAVSMQTLIENVLAQSGLSVTTYETDLRSGLAVDQLTAGCSWATSSPMPRWPEFSRWRTSSARLRFALLPLAHYGSWRESG